MKNIVNTDAQKRGTEHQRENVYFAEEIHDAGRGKKETSGQSGQRDQNGSQLCKEQDHHNRSGDGGNRADEGGFRGGS